MDVFSAADNTNDTLETAVATEATDSKWIQVQGGNTNSANIHSDYAPEYFGTCSGSVYASSPDAVVGFRVDSSMPVRIDTEGSFSDTVLALRAGGVAALRNYTLDNHNNENNANALDLGLLNGAKVTVTGSTIAGAASDYLASTIDGASSPSCAAGEGKPDVVFKFNLNQNNSSVRIKTESATAFDNVISLHSPAPPEGSVTAVAVTNEDQAHAKDAGTINHKDLYFSGTTEGMDDDYPQVEVGCNAGDTSPDAVFKFNLSSPTEVQIDTEGSAFDTVAALYSGSISNVIVYDLNAATPPNNNETAASAKEVGDTYDKWHQVRGKTTYMAANYLDSYVGCTANSDSRDAVVGFSVSQADTPVQIDTEKTAFDTVIVLYKRGAGAAEIKNETTVSNDNHTVLSDDFDLGAMDSKAYEITGPSIALVGADYLDTTIGCGTDDEKPDVAFKFSVKCQEDGENRQFKDQLR